MQTLVIKEQILTLLNRAESILSAESSNTAGRLYLTVDMIKHWNGQYEMYSSKEKELTSLSKVLMLELGADMKDGMVGLCLQLF